MIQAHPANKPFTNIGEIGQLFRTDAYLTDATWRITRASVRLNLADPNVQNIFKYLTVIDPITYIGDPMKPESKAESISIPPRGLSWRNCPGLQILMNLLMLTV